MDKLIASIPPVTNLTEIPSGNEILRTLQSSSNICDAVLNDTIKYYTSLVNDIKNIDQAVTYLSKLDKIKAKLRGPSLSKCGELVQAIIIRQQVTSKFPDIGEMFPIMFKGLRREWMGTESSAIILTKGVKPQVNACWIFVNDCNTSIHYKSNFKQAGCPTFTSFIIKTMYYLNMCMRIYGKVNVATMKDTVSLAGCVDVSHVNIKWNYVLDHVDASTQFEVSEKTITSSK